MTGRQFPRFQRASRSCAKSIPWLSLFVKISVSLEKHWLPDLEWQTPSNWLNNLVPEADNRVVFPVEMRHAAGLPRSGDLALAEIDLPRNGHVVLPYRGRLEISPVAKRPNGKVAAWRREGPLFWADPDNWDASVAAPDLERIPCSSDVAIFPMETRTISVRLPKSNVRVKAVKMVGQSEPLARWEWMKLEDRREFSEGPFSLRYGSLRDCEECPCQDKGQTELLSEVCEIQERKCGSTRICEYPLKVEGHCCHYCGARVVLSAKAAVSKVEEKVNRVLAASKYDLAWYVRRTWNDETEVLITEKSSYTGMRSAEAVENLAEILREQGLEVLRTEAAGAALMASKLAVTLGPLLGALLIVLALLLAAFPYFGHSLTEIIAGLREVRVNVNEDIRARDSSRSGRPFAFARFDNVPEGSVELAHPADTIDHNQQLAEQGSSCSFTSGRFINPLYRSGRDSAKVAEVLKVDEPVSLTALEKAVADRPDYDEVASNR